MSRRTVQGGPGSKETGEGRMHPVPTSGLSGSAEHPMDDAQTLSKRTSERHCVSPMGGRSTPALQEVQHAMQPILPTACEYGDMQGGDGAAEAAEFGDRRSNGN